MWEMGHSFDEIDAMSLEDISDIVGYWSGKAEGETKLRKTRKNLDRT
jgi:hypothetical protein